MSNDESEVERRAGADMVPVGESFEWNPGREAPADSTIGPDCTARSIAVATRSNMARPSLS